MVWKVAQIDNHRYSVEYKATMVAVRCSPLRHSVENSWPPGKVGVFQAVVGCCRAASTHSNPIAGEL